MNVTKKLVLSAGLVLLGAAQAQVELKPVLQPLNCKAIPQITPPAGANAQYYLSDDCSVAYVLPREFSPLKITEMRLSHYVDQGQCESIDRVVARQEKVEEIISELRSTQVALLKRLAIKDGDEASIRQSLATVEESLKSANVDFDRYAKREPFSKLPGVTMNVAISLDSSGAVSDYVEANKALTDVKFMNARISNGLIAFRSKKKEGGTYNDILFTDIPGNAVGNDQIEVNEQILLNGGLTGNVTLTQPTVCSLIRKLDATGTKTVFNRDLATPERITTAGLSINYSYNVPVATNISFKFDAKIKANDLAARFENEKIDTQFGLREIQNLLTEGALENTINITFGDGGMPMDLKTFVLQNDPSVSTPRGNILTELYGHSMDMYMEQVTAKLLQMGMIMDPKNVEVQAAVKPFTRDVSVSTLENCKWKTNWLGRSKKDCKTYRYETVKFIPGVSSATKNITDTSSAKVYIDFKSNQTLNMSHTTGFIPMKGKQ